MFISQSFLFGLFVNLDHNIVLTNTQYHLQMNRFSLDKMNGKCEVSPSECISVRNDL